MSVITDETAKEVLSLLSKDITDDRKLQLLELYLAKTFEQGRQLGKTQCINNIQATLGRLKED